MREPKIWLQIVTDHREPGQTLFCDNSHVENLKIVMEKFALGFSNDVTVYYLEDFNMFSAENTRIPVESVYSALSTAENNYRPDWKNLSDDDVVKAVKAIKKLLTER